LTDILPKPVVPLLDAPLACAGLNRLADVAPKVFVNVSHLADRVRSVLSAGCSEVSFEILDEGTEPYGTAGTLRALLPHIEDLAVTMNGDLVTDLRLEDLLRTHEDSGAPASAAVIPVAAGGDLVCADGFATGFIDRRKDLGAPGYRFIGAAVFTREAIEALPPTRPLGLGETLIRDHAAAGTLAVHVHEGTARDVGSPVDYLAASLAELARRGLESYAAPDARFEPEQLGPGGMLLAGSSLGSGSYVERSLVWPGEHVPNGMRLADSIFAGGVPLQVGPAT
jgi:NDP-sugar pyrophosphorylase family protein